MAKNGIVVAQLRQNGIGELFSQLHSPLVKAEHIPDDTLYENLVLVKCNQASKAAGRDFFEQNRVGRPVAGENFKW